MKKLLSIIILGLFFIVLGCEKDSLFDTKLDDDIKVSVRATDAEIEAMIEGGVLWLLDQRNPGDGSFSEGQEIVARTAMAVVKLCDKSIEEGFQPLDPAGTYYNAIDEGLIFIKSQGRDGPLGGKYYYNLSYDLPVWHHQNYNTAWALMAFVASRDFDAYKSYAQGAADYFTFDQAANGGWGYYAGPGSHGNQSWQDNSNTGYVVLALVAAQNFGCAVDPAVVTNHETWVNVIQDGATGGSKYKPSGWDWINMIKTGNLLFEMAFVGDKATTPRVEFAVQYIQNTWNASGAGQNDPGWKPNNYQAMYTMMKGFTALSIDEINVGGPVDWYDDFSESIWDTKIADGPDKFYWPADGAWTDEYISTVFALLTLEKVVELPRIEVNLDIKPTSCPNPFNMKANGVLPVAILGSAECDVSQIDFSTLTLAGVAPIRSDMEDVAAPVVDPTEECECTTAGPDGYMDLTLKFDRQEIATALGDVADGDVITLTINGELFSGLALIGTDCIVIIKKGKK